MQLPGVQFAFAVVDDRGSSSWLQDGRASAAEDTVMMLLQSWKVMSLLLVQVLAVKLGWSPRIAMTTQQKALTITRGEPCVSQLWFCGTHSVVQVVMI